MNAKTFLPFFVTSLSFLLSSCQEMVSKNNQLIGCWELIVEEGEKLEPFENFCTLNSFYMCTEKIYITENQIEYPLGFYRDNEYKTDNFLDYDIQNDKLVITKDTVTYALTLKLRDNTLCLGEKDKICFRKSPENFYSIDSAFIWFQSSYYSPSLSIEIQREICEIFDQGNFRESWKYPIKKADYSYLLELLGRIHREDLNRIYNNNVSDCREYKLDFVPNEERKYSIMTCDFGFENPFEVRAFLINLFRLLEKITSEEY